ncbi:hypothetical protein FRB95_013447 [Tulasnella sp. JGI-2019a]|nr:hypothetical protein FRB95_013447 [Tulasnella sp. JGI-2019a]
MFNSPLNESSNPPLASHLFQMAFSSDVSSFGLRRQSNGRDSRRHPSLLSRRPVASCQQSLDKPRKASLLGRDLRKPTLLPIDVAAIECVAPQFKGLNLTTITEALTSPEMQSRMIEGLSKSSIALGPNGVSLDLRGASTSVMPPTHLLSLRSDDGTIASLLPCHALPLLASCATLPSMASESSFPETLPVIDIHLPSPSTFHIIRDYGYTRCRRSLLSVLLPLDPSRPVPPTPQAMAAAYAASLSVSELSAQVKTVQGVYLNACRVGVVDDEFWKSLQLSWNILLMALRSRNARMPQRPHVC